MVPLSTSIQGVSSSTDISTSTVEAASDELDKNSFLTLLVTQLQYQDPLNPQDNQEFVAQLATFSQLEQSQSMNDSLSAVYLAISSMNNASMTQLLGQQIVAKGDTFHYASGDEELHYDAASAVQNATLTITNADGSVVYTEELGGLDEGEGSYTWDGSTISGIAEEGDYTFTITGTDTAGDDVEITALIAGVIDGMSFEEGTPTPSIEGIDLSLGDIIRVETP